ncbi:MAG: glycoside hydrolase family 2 TIM barrel-domain containing protein, partial [Rikenellaceae bacterium]
KQPSLKVTKPFSVVFPLQNPAVVYRTTFKVPLVWDEREIFLNMEHLAGSSVVYVNGKRVGYNEDSRAMAEFNISDASREGLNFLTVVSYGFGVASYLESADSYADLEIGGNVTVWSAPKVRLRDYISTTSFDPEYKNGLLEFGALIKTHYLNPAEVKVFFDLIDPDGNTIDSQNKLAQLNMRIEDTVYFNVPIHNVKKWSAEQPNLYSVVIRVQKENRWTEFVKLPIGFRQIDILTNQMLINNVPVTIKGVTVSKNDIPLTKEKMKLFLEEIKRSGANSLWVDAPQNNDFYTLADQIGFYIFSNSNIDGSASGNTLRYGVGNNRSLLEKFISRTLNMYEVTKNHPAVVAFSLGNDSGNGYNMYETYLMLKAKDSKRPIIYPGAGLEWNTNIYLPNNETGADISEYTPNTDHPTIVIKSDGKKFADLWGAIKANPAVQGAFLKNLSLLKSPDIAELYAGVKIEYAASQLTLTNNMDSTPLSEYKVAYQLTTDGKEGEKLAINFDAQQGKSQTQTLNIPKFNSKNDTYLTITISSNKGSIIAQKIFKL